jgi:hypothetical protein
MTRSFQAPERIGAKELADLGDAARLDALNATMSGLEQVVPTKGTTDHDGDGKMGGVKGRKPKAKK